MTDVFPQNTEIDDLNRRVYELENAIQGLNPRNLAGLSPSIIRSLTAVDSQVFAASGTWTKPENGNLAFIQCWGGGGSGARDDQNNGVTTGGGGGSYSERFIAVSSLGATETVTIGDGGASKTSGNVSGAAGGDTTFGSFVTAKGGSAGNRSVGDWCRGADGGTLESISFSFAGITGVAGGGDGVASTVPAHGLYSGASGSNTNATGSAAAEVSGNSVFGGAGGGCACESAGATAGGTSVFGGSGGAGASGGNATDGSVPGGGGGSVSGTQGANGGGAGNSGAGGKGYCIVTVF